MGRPVTTLFMLMSVDGKISTGSTDEMDFDKDIPHIAGVADGVDQYYAAEQETESVSLNSGRVMAKIGVNKPDFSHPHIDCLTFVIVDNSHLTRTGVENLAKWVGKLIVATDNENHPAHSVSGVEIIKYRNPARLFDELGKRGVERMTIQSGGTLNAYFIRAGLVDYIDLFVAPMLVGGTNTQSLIGGESIVSESGLEQIRPLKLLSAQALANSYLRLRYEIVKMQKG
jgi:2,5-diamino-6-(ribosylamino)-4(3H)-pyrimidinone 5'-phosphate reductase